MRPNIIETCKHGVIQATCTQCWPNGNMLLNGAAALGKLGGRSKSEAKTSASRENGKLGGRPKKHSL